ncbi:MAG: biopolymer transporter ExbD [Planctomycetota bacterium]|nr:MAG: biopolymer transporter ExbD [Planctomycetota bacterium]
MNTRFQRRSILDRAPGSGVPNMTPMVDVTLVILIFFMASATIAGPEWFLRAELPEGRPTSALALPSPVVRAEVFTRDNATLVRGIGPERPIEDAINAIAAMDPSTADGLVVEIQTADETPYAEVVRLHAALVDAGADVRLR